MQQRRLEYSRLITDLQLSLDFEVPDRDQMVDWKGLEPSTSAMRMPRSSQLSYQPSGVACHA